MMNFISNVETGFKGIVDVLMLLVIIVLSVFDLFSDIDLTGGYVIFATYIFWLVYRIGFFKNALNRYVTNAEYREKLRLPGSMDF